MVELSIRKTRINSLTSIITWTTNKKTAKNLIISKENKQKKYMHNRKIMNLKNKMMESENGWKTMIKSRHPKCKILVLMTCKI
jgi:hypothetical protein